MKATFARKLFFIAILLVTGFASARGQTLYVPSGTVGNSGNSNIGIATSSPTVRLDFGTSMANQKRIIGTYNLGNVFAGIGMDATTAGIRLAGDPTVNNNPLIDVGYYSTDGNFTWTSRAYFAGNGNVGIGTTSPLAPLEVRRAGGVGAVQISIDNVLGALTRDAFFTIRPDSSSDAGGFLFRTHNGASGDVNAVAMTAIGNVGIGTTNPAGRLDVETGKTLLQSTGLAYSGAEVATLAVGGSAMIFANIGQLRISDGTANSKALLLGYDGPNNVGFISTFNSGVGYTNLAIVPNGGNVGIGTTNPTQKLSVNGTIRAKEVIVEASPWPDDVFDESYKLKALSEIEAFVHTEGHLPGVPSAATVGEQGVGLGEMQKTLLRKVEELTLYMIEVKKENAALRAEVEALKQAVNR